LGPDNPEQENR
jgi:hypothetical protein